MDFDRHGRHGLRIDTAHLSISKIYHSELLSECANSKRGYGARSNFKHSRFEVCQVRPVIVCCGCVSHDVSWEVSFFPTTGWGGGGGGARARPAHGIAWGYPEATHVAESISKVQQMTSKC